MKFNGLRLNSIMSVLSSTVSVGMYARWAAKSEPHQNLHVPSRSSVPHAVPGAHALQRVSMVSSSKCWNVNGASCRYCDGANVIFGRRKWWLVPEVFGRMLPHVICVPPRCVAPARRLEGLKVCGVLKQSSEHAHKAASPSRYRCLCVRDNPHSYEPKTTQKHRRTDDWVELLLRV